MRFYLVLKPPTDNDVEGVFMANSLSSFTLGSVQLVGIISFLVNLKEAGGYDALPMTVKLNFKTWMVNWVITVLYFLTPIALRMKNAAAVEALTYNAIVEHREDMGRLLVA